MPAALNLPTLVLGVARCHGAAPTRSPGWSTLVESPAITPAAASRPPTLVLVAAPRYGVAPTRSPTWSMLRRSCAITPAAAARPPVSICRAARLGDAAFTKKEWMEEIYRQLPNGNARHSYLPRPRNSERPALAPAPSPGRLAAPALAQQPAPGQHTSANL